MQPSDALFQPLRLPCGVSLKNRIAKSAMSDSLGDGTGHPTPGQNHLYRRWAEGGLAVSIIGEVQPTPHYAEKPGNLVLNASSDLARFRELANNGTRNGAQIWLQLGHAGALAYAPTSIPKGPSALDLPGLHCDAVTVAEIHNIPADFAATAQCAQKAGFGGVQIHAAHGFLLSQFLSPLFNKRDDEFGGSIANRMRLLLNVIKAVRDAVGPDFPVAVKLNTSDQLEGGLDNDDALSVVATLNETSVDLIDLSGGTYFPGAKAASDGAGRGPYFLEFAKRARTVTTKPLMLTGGFKTRAQAQNAVADGIIDMVGLARALVLEPTLPNQWRADQLPAPIFPKFSDPPEGGVTAWYTMRLTALAAGTETPDIGDLAQTVVAYEARDKARSEVWLRHFGHPAAQSEG